ncbi:MAG: 30S ribosomal protein S16 [Actinobacteria bacterium]|nr:30S ribosomal protein S16 [Actinomycetota bacterium]
MAVKIRLARAGAKKAPFYRVVAADSRAPRDGRFIEILGRYNPRTDPSTIELDLEKVDAWLAKGALPTETVAKLIAAAKDPGAKAPAREAALSKKAQAKAVADAKAAEEAAAAPEKAPVAEDAPAEESPDVQAEEVAETAEPEEAHAVETEQPEEAPAAAEEVSEEAAE